MKKAQSIITKMLKESYDKQFDEWYAEMIDPEWATSMGNGDPAIGQSVFFELWELNLISGEESREELERNLRSVDFYTMEEADKHWGLSEEGFDVDSDADMEGIENFFYEKGMMAREVQYTDSNGNFGYGLIVSGGY